MTRLIDIGGRCGVGELTGEVLRERLREGAGSVSRCALSSNQI